MFFTILIVFFSLILLIILHELGHFLVAKKFGVKVEEFGVFLPPRLFGKKIGETIYSINLIPFGAFVRIQGEEGQEGDIHNIRSFSSKPIWQRFLIVVGGVVAFWIVAAILLSFVMWLGAPVAVSDQEDDSFKNFKVQIAQVFKGSPAEVAGLKIGDVIKELSIAENQLPEQNKEFETSQIKRVLVDKVKTVQEFTEQNKGNEIMLTIQRGKKVLETVLVPRVSPPENEGPMGIVLVRTTEKRYPWYQAPFKGVEATVKITGAVINGLFEIISNLVTGKGVPKGVQLMGPIGIGVLLTQFAQSGLSQYLYFIAVISIYLAIFNILPIPALDGGKLIFLGIEKIKGRPLHYKIEQRITAFFFLFLLFLMILVTVQDIIKLW